MKDTKSTTILPSGFTITAHAGALDTEANTLDSVRVCLENADIAEIDLRFLPDGTPVLSHNSPSADAARLEDAFRLLKQFPDKRMNVDVKATTDMPLVQKLAEEIGVLPQVFFYRRRQALCCRRPCRCAEDPVLSQRRYLSASQIQQSLPAAFGASGAAFWSDRIEFQPSQCDNKNRESSACKRSVGFHLDCAQRGYGSKDPVSRRG